jgi:hypothetical protein
MQLTKPRRPPIDGNIENKVIAEEFTSYPLGAKLTTNEILPY